MTKPTVVEDDTPLPVLINDQSIPQQVIIDKIPKIRTAFAFGN